MIRIKNEKYGNVYETYRICFVVLFLKASHISNGHLREEREKSQTDVTFKEVMIKKLLKLIDSIKPQS